MPSEFDKTIQANPSKEFFIDMLTRDISLSECVLDLVDNSVHSLIRRNELDVMRQLFQGQLPKKTVTSSVDINFSPTRFFISDTCGGISIKEAREQVFLFGKPEPDPTHSGLGVYGIGMKRAMFKIGRLIKVKSNTTEEEFQVDLDVEQWKKKESWTHEFTTAKRRASFVGGTSIEVTGLHETPSKYFGMQSFATTLRERIATTYALFLKAGLKIRINKTPVEADIPDFAAGKDLKPVRHMTKRDRVEILIMIGLTPKEDRIPRGWYVFCNGRAVLSADKTDRTGWGINNTPEFHPRHNHFLGFVYFCSKDVRRLPWTTTKEGVERESPVYQYALSEMRTLSRPVLDFCNKLYGEVREEGAAEHQLLESSKPIQLQNIAGRPNTAFKATPSKKSDYDMVSVQYKKTRKEIEKARTTIGKKNMSASAIGEFTFNWFLRRNT